MTTHKTDHDNKGDRLSESRSQFVRRIGLRTPSIALQSTRATL